MTALPVSQDNTAIPIGWTRVRLGEVAHRFVSGGTPSTRDSSLWEGDVPWITSKWLNNRLHLLNGEKYISPAAIKASATSIVPQNSLIIATRVGVGKVAINAIDLAINQDLTGIVFDGSVIDLPFLAFQLRSGQIQRAISAHKRGATIQGITRDTLKNLELFIPPIEEQRKIAAVLSLVQSAIEQQERLIALTAELKKSLMHKLFTEGLRGEPQKETEIGIIPESWEVVRLGDCATVQTGVAKGRRINLTESIDLPYLRVANVQDGRLDLAEIKTISIRKSEKERFLLRDKDVVLTEGGDLDKLGRGFLWRSEVPDCVHQNHIFAIRVERTRLSPEFFAYQSQSPYGKAYFLSVAHKTTNLASINTTKLKNFPVLIPSMEEQGDIANLLEAVDSKLAIHAHKRLQFNNLFQSLLHHLMTAKIRVSDFQINS